MFTTGFKFYFGLGLVMLVAAVAYGYSTGGGGLGPFSLGWEGGVGDHVGYVVLTALGVVSMTVSFVIVAFRDADPGEQAHYVGVERVATNPPVSGSYWPVIAAFGAAAVVVGLALDAAVVVFGLVILAIAAIEWTMDAWTDRASGDIEANRAFRNRIMGPIEMPALGAIIVGVAIVATSRIFLAVSALGAVIVAGVVAAVIVALATLYISRPNMGRSMVAGVAMVAAVGLLAGGVIAAVAGERDFEHHSDESGEESGVDGHDGSDTGEPAATGEGSTTEAEG